MRHYIIFGSSNDYLQASYKDVNAVDGAVYQAGMLPNACTLVRKIHTAHCCTSFAQKYDLPFRKMWYKKYCSQKFVPGDEYVFLFFHNWRPIFQRGYIEYLRKEYPGCKCVLLLNDINRARELNISDEKKRFDYITVFERNFARENDIEYYPLVYSDYRSEVSEAEKDIDILFVGWAKGRYKFLKSIYDRLTSEGINCQFYLTKLDEKVPEESGIHTADWVPYKQYTDLLKRSKCLLDIVPQNTDCNTLRVNEAVSYKCKILTNNSKIVFEKFYNPENISVYSSADDIDTTFLLKQYLSPDYGEYIVEMSPKSLTEHLDKVLFERGE